MSRATDLETSHMTHDKASEKIYEDISAALCKETSGLLEIEVLGKGYLMPPNCNVLVDGDFIGVPKYKLVQAFVIARKILFRLKSKLNGRQEELRQATAVVLLMDPEHLTAANTRKRVLQQNRLCGGQIQEIEEAWKRELSWVDGMLTSRLHRHTKSPTLWSHRRWLLKTFSAVNLTMDVAYQLKRVVLVAAERHPRNYYAWSHMRWIMQTLPTDSVVISSIVLSWCLQHPDDISGFSFLLVIVSNMPEQSRSALKQVLHLASSFHWTHESVWVFCRTLVTLKDCERAAFFQTMEDILESRRGDPRATNVLSAARNWYMDFEAKSNPTDANTRPLNADLPGRLSQT